MKGNPSMMRHQLGICTLLIAAFGAPVAMAGVMTTYTINFTGGAILPTEGTFTYDPDTQTFTSFSVTWDSVFFDLTSSANAPGFGGGGGGTNPPICIGALSGGAASFALLTGACTSPPINGNTFWLGTKVDVGHGFLFESFDGLGGKLVILEFIPQQLGEEANPSIGQWTTTEVIPPVSEPSSVIPISIMLLAAFVARKRMAQGFRQATRRA